MTFLLITLSGVSWAASGPVVVLDPGHGGPKVGAVSARGDHEKEIALEIARKLKAELEKASVRVLMTRENDKDVELKERIRFANEAGADVFVSIHLNSMPKRYWNKVRGIETYFLSMEATGERARQVAALENAEAGEQAAASDDLAFILNDLAQTQAHRDASRLAYAVHQQLVADLKATDRGVHQAPFIVLMGAQMPAILAEVGFLSHSAEAKQLRDAAHQEKIARSLARAITAFLETVGGRDRALGGKAEGSVVDALTESPSAR
ncbi:MAG: N-acetylmuramoyl-L-alanine amidase family protein [Myxococcales bacterium]